MGERAVTDTALIFWAKEIYFFLYVYFLRCMPNPICDLVLYLSNEGKKMSLKENFVVLFR